VAVALVVAAVTGVLTGLAIQLNSTARGILEPLLEFYRPIPPLAYLPLVIIWFGIGEFAKVFVIYLGIFPAIVIATVDGLRSVAQDKIFAARSLGATRLQVVTLILLPHALPTF
jgi:taurine transport system permease protein